MIYAKTKLLSQSLALGIALCALGVKGALSTSIHEGEKPMTVESRHDDREYGHEGDGSLTNTKVADRAEETLEKVRNKTEEMAQKFGHRVKEVGKKAGHRAEETGTKVKNRAEEVAKNVKEKAKDIK